MTVKSINCRLNLFISRNFTLHKEYEYKLEIEGDREIYVRKATVIKEDGDVVGRSFERYSVKPEAAYDAEPEMIRIEATIT